MIPKEVLQQIRRLHIVSRAIVDEALAGQYHSVFKGRGMEFDEVRPYTPGDDVRTIDWNVTARTGFPHIKRYVEERELTVMLLVDLSASGEFGTGGRTRAEIAVELCAVLAFSAIKNNDNVGLILFTSEVEKYLPPKKGQRHVLRVIRELLYHRRTREGTDITRALEYLRRVQSKRAVVFVVSDFLSAGYEKALSLARRRHDVIAVQLVDPRERALPAVGLIELEDLETGGTLLVDAGSLTVRRAYEESGARAAAALETAMRRSGVDFVPIPTDRPYLEPLRRFFRLRERRR